MQIPNRNFFFLHYRSMRELLYSLSKRLNGSNNLRCWINLRLLNCYNKIEKYQYIVKDLMYYDKK